MIPMSKDPNVNKLIRAILDEIECKLRMVTKEDDLNIINGEYLKYWDTWAIINQIRKRFEEDV